MIWLEITLHTTPGTVEKTTDELTAEGFDDFVVEDQAEFEAFLEKNRNYWDYIDEGLRSSMQGLSRIRLYLTPEDKQPLARLQAFSDARGLSMRVEQLPDVDWSARWKESFQPVKVGSRLIVLPEWMADSDPQGRVPIILNPGLIFGTGEHITTRLAMQALAFNHKPVENCLDLGSGSGILSITALRLGAQTATGVDVDPVAEDVARANAALNGFSAPRATFLTGDILEDDALMERLARRQYDVVTVNIVAEVIVRLAPALPKFLHTDSLLILSGILNERMGDVMQALSSAGIHPAEIHSEEGWSCITAKKGA